MTRTFTSDSTLNVELKPSYNLPIAIIVLAIPLLIVNTLVGGIVGLLGLFLMFQAGTIRLEFSATDLNIYRGDKLIRQFPYREWQNWHIFWDKVPILFYFKEVKSIHFLPILFDPNTLKACLEQRCPQI